MGKYIVTFDNTSEVKEEGLKYFRCAEAPWWYTEEQTISRLTPYTEPDLEQVRQEAYQKGLDDAWECAKRLFLGVSNGGFENSEIKEIFGYDDEEQVVMKHTAAEAIEKIRQYEQEGKIQVGDEVEAMAGKAVIIEVLDNGKAVRYMYSDASYGVNASRNVTRTGRYFPEIADVFKKMKGESNDPD